jgi:hypothetical protein
MVSRIDSMLVDCHWAQMVSYRATRSCNCHLPDHVPELLLLSTTLTFYSCDRPCPWAATPGSHQPPDSGKGSRWCHTVQPGATAAVFPTMFPSYCCCRQLRPSIPVTGHVHGLLLPAHTNLLILARALAVLLLGWLCPPVPHDWSYAWLAPGFDYPTSSTPSVTPQLSGELSGPLLAFLHALSIRPQWFCAPPLCGVFCNPSNLLDVILLP